MGVPARTRPAEYLTEANLTLTLTLTLTEADLYRVNLTRADLTVTIVPENSGSSTINLSK